MAKRYKYRCGTCQTTSVEYKEVQGARDHGVTHRAGFHGGDRPDGEEILVVRTPITVWHMIGFAVIALMILNSLADKA